MATRKIIDIEQNGEKVWPKGHANATFMSNGTTVEDAINSIQAGTGGGVVYETDPIFSASPAASITEAKKTEWDNKVDKVSGKQLSTQDFTTELEGKLKGIEANAQKNVQSDWNENDTDSDTYVNNRTHYSYDIEPVASFSVASKNEGDILVTGLNEGAFYRLYGSKSDSFHFVLGRKLIIPAYGPTMEAVCAYDDDSDTGCLKLTTPTYGLTESFDLMEIHVEQLDDVYIPETIARKDEIATINGQSLTEGGDITIKGESLTESDIAAMGFTKNTGTYSKPSTGIPKTDLASEVQTSLGKADTAIQSTSFGELTDLALVKGFESSQRGTIYALPDEASGDEDDVLLSRGSVKTINGQSIFGSGNIEISGGEGGGTSSDGRKEVIYVDMESTITSMRPNVIYWIVGLGDISIESFEEPVYGVDTYDVFTAIIEFEQYNDTTSLTLPDYVQWANGIIPGIVAGEQELSISRISDGDYTKYYAVLTPFKSV